MKPKHPQKPLSLWAHLLSWLFPEHCVNCGEPLNPSDRRNGACALCLSNLQTVVHETLYDLDLGPDLESSCGAVIFPCRVAGPYRNQLGESIRRMKFHGKTSHAKGLGHMAAVAAQSYSAVFDKVSFVPMTQKSLRKRGFNQSALLAEVLAEILEIPCEALLSKTGDTASQHTLDAQRRQHNLRGKFLPLPACRDQRILLVDDICTTGHTLSECAQTLYRGGAKEVRGVCAAGSQNGHFL